MWRLALTRRQRQWGLNAIKIQIGIAILLAPLALFGLSCASDNPRAPICAHPLSYFAWNLAAAYLWPSTTLHFFYDTSLSTPAYMFGQWLSGASTWIQWGFQLSMYAFYLIASFAVGVGLATWRNRRSRKKS